MAIVEINAWGCPTGQNVLPQIKWELLWLAWPQEYALRRGRTVWLNAGALHWRLVYLEMPLAGRYGWFP